MPRSPCGPTNINARLQTCMGGILAIDDLPQSFDSLITDEIDGAATETTAHHASAQHTWNVPRNLHKRVQLDRADLVLVTQAGMRLPEKRPYLLNQSLFQQFRRSQDTGIFSDHVACAPAQ